MSLMGLGRRAPGQTLLGEAMERQRGADGHDVEDRWRIEGAMGRSRIATLVVALLLAILAGGIVLYHLLSNGSHP